MPLSDCRIIELPKIDDSRGSLTFIEANQHIPFDIKRIYYLYGMPRETSRGFHAHKQLCQFIVAMAGSFDVILDDGKEQRRFSLYNPSSGLYVAPMMWRSLENFSLDAVCMVLASEYFTETDYIRDYEQFRQLTGP